MHGWNSLEEAVLNSGMLYCHERNTDCFGMLAANGTGAECCQYQNCVLDDPEYVAKEKRKEKRRQELYEASLKDEKEEKDAAKLIRTQHKTRINILEEEIAFVRKRMQRFYARGWTKLGESESKRLAELERELEKIK